MNYFESGIVTRAEYDANREDRVRETSITAGEIYTGMFALKPNTAAKLPVSIEVINKRTPYL